MTKKWILFGALLLGLALAQSLGSMRLDLQAFRVLKVQENNKLVEKYETAVDARPGQLIEYRLEANNPTGKPIEQVSLVIPIPQSMTYQALSAEPLKVGDYKVIPQFSFDGGHTFGLLPLKRTVREVQNGKEVLKEVEVKAEEFTHVRWVLPRLEIQQNVALKLRAVVR